MQIESNTGIVILVGANTNKPIIGLYEYDRGSLHDLT